MNILLINHYAGSIHHGMEFRPYYLAQEWIKLGHKVQIIAASQSHVRNKQPTTRERIETELLDGIEYQWYETPKYTGNGIARVKNIFSFVYALWKNASKISKDFQPDVVIASSTYPMDIWAAHRIAKLSKAKLVFEVHDLWPLSPMELGKMSKWHPFIMLVQLAEDYAYKNAGCIVSMLPNAKNYMISRGMQPSKFHYIPNGINTEEWADTIELPTDVKLSIEKIKQRGKPLIGYTGTHGLANALDTLLDVAKLAPFDFEVVLIGNGPERERLMHRAKEECINNVNFLSAVDKLIIPTLLKEIDITYIGLLPEPLFRFGISPNKLMDYMMAATPIIMAIKAGNDPVTEANCGFTVKPGDVNEIHNSIMKLIKLTDLERRELGKRGRTFVLTEHTYPILAQRFINALKN